jgi:hypothetical protein
MTGEGAHSTRPQPCLGWAEWWVTLWVWLYLTLTQPHGLMWFDSGELALSAHTWGLGHPPGQPLYTALGALISSLPGAPLWWLNQLSCLSISLSIPALYILHEALSADPTQKGLSSNATAHHSSHSPRVARPMSLHLITASLPLFYPIWDQGARIEVYAMGTLFVVWSLAWSASAIYRPGSLSQRRRWALLAGLSLGGCGATQPIFAIAAGVTLLCSGRSTLRWAFRHGVIGLSLGFILPHLYIVWVTQQSDGFIWGNWTDLRSILHYFSGGDYRHTPHAAWERLPEHALQWLLWMYEQGGGLWLLFGWGGWALSPSKAHLSWILPSVLIGGLFPLTYEKYWPEVPDYSGYFLPALCLGLLGFWWLTLHLARSHGRLILHLLPLTLIISLISQGPPLSHRDRSSHHLPLSLAQDWLSSLPQQSILLVSSDHWVFPLIYSQEVLGARPDVLVINLGFEQSSWYWRWLTARHPDALKDIDLNTSRLPQLKRRLPHRPIFTESLWGMRRLMSEPPCPARWGWSIDCAHSLPLPDPQRVRSWIAPQHHSDPITAKVLARLGFGLTLSAWHLRETHLAIELGSAFLDTPQALSPPPSLPWRPIPPGISALMSQQLIGDPALLSSLLSRLNLPSSPLVKPKL